MTTEANAQALYEILLANAGSDRLRTSLDRVWKACNALAKQGAPITVAAVGHQCEEMFGGPKVQSIRNSKDCLAQYIQQRAAEQKGEATKRTMKSGGPVIEDESVRAYVRTLEIQLQQANNDLRRLKSGLRQLKPMDTQGIGNLIGEPLPEASASEAIQVPESVRNDIRKFLDPQRLESCGIKEIDGELEFSSGLVILQQDGLSFLKSVI